jgi:hypothetical protein
MFADPRYALFWLVAQRICCGLMAAYFFRELWRARKFGSIDSEEGNVSRKREPLAFWAEVCASLVGFLIMSLLFVGIIPIGR